MPKLLPCLVRMLLPAQALCLSAQEVIELNGETAILDESPYYVPHATSSTENYSFGSPIYQPLEVTHPALEGDHYLGYWDNFLIEQQDRASLEIPASPLLQFNVLVMEPPDSSRLPLEEADWSKLFQQAGGEDTQMLLMEDTKLDLSEIEEPMLHEEAP